MQNDFYFIYVCEERELCFQKGKLTLQINFPCFSACPAFYRLHYQSFSASLALGRQIVEEENSWQLFSPLSPPNYGYSSCWVAFLQLSLILPPHSWVSLYSSGANNIVPLLLVPGFFTILCSYYSCHTSVLCLFIEISVNSWVQLLPDMKEYRMKREISEAEVSLPSHFQHIPSLDQNKTKTMSFLLPPRDGISGHTYTI